MSRTQRHSAASEPRARQSLDPEMLKGTLLEGQSIETLQALGLVTERGGANANAHRKIKQINHFINQIAPALDELFERYPEPVLFDAATGKSYLAFAIFELYIKRLGRGRMVTCEMRPDLVKRVRELAQKLNFGDRFSCIQGRILEVPLPERIHFTLALHACDTATDEALIRALEAKSDFIALVPCCQAELAQKLKSCDSVLSPLWHHPWHRREFGAHMTNVIRALTLQARGYQVNVTELAGWEHSLKNELITGKRMGNYHKGAQSELKALLEQIPVTPWLHETLAAREKPVPAPESSEPAP